MKVTILGCGGSLGVPSLGSIGWGDCDPAEPKNCRTRASILIEQDGFRLLVDSGPDVRQQLLALGNPHVDAVFYTHEHADHTHGIDDVRGYTMRSRKSIPVYLDRKTFDELNARFSYLFVGNFEDQTTPSRKVGLEPHVIDPNGTIQIGPFTVETFNQSHGYGSSLGLRIGNFAYSTDVSYLSRKAFSVLAGVKIWIVDCNNRKQSDTNKHSWPEQTFDWIEKIAPKQAYLTHLPAWWDYKTLAALCPCNVQPLYDGLILSV